MKNPGSSSNGNWRTYKKINKEERLKRKKRNRKIRLGVSSLIILLLVVFFNPITNTSAYVLTADGKEIMTVKGKKERLDELVSMAKDNIESKINMDVKIKEDLKWEFKMVPKSKELFEDLDSVPSEIAKNVSYDINAYAVFVNGKRKAVFRNEKEAEKALEKIKREAYVLRDDESEEDITRNFVEDVELRRRVVAQDEINTSDKGYEILTNTTEEAKTYKAVAGDHLDLIASKNNMDKDKLMELNPGVTENSIIRIGQEFNLMVPKPLVSVEVRKREVVVEDIKPPVKRIFDESKYKGYKYTKKRGRTGERKVTRDVVYVNGIKKGTEVINEEILKEATETVVVEGTKANTRASQSRGSFVRPIKGSFRISSYYGEARTIYGQYSIHRGVDYAIRPGTTVYASRGGTVEEAGYLGTYGYAVIIKHSNGYESRYAHNSKILVKPGDKVEQGEPIAKSGNTGRSTGPHLHFEIRKYDKPISPAKFIG